MELLCAIGNCLACQVWQACRRLLTPDLNDLFEVIKKLKGPRLQDMRPETFFTWLMKPESIPSAPQTHMKSFPS